MKAVPFKIVHHVYPVKHVIAKICKDIDLKCVFSKDGNESIVRLCYDYLYAKTILV